MFVLNKINLVTDLKHCSSVSIVDLEKVNAAWVARNSQIEQIYFTSILYENLKNCPIFPVVQYVYPYSRSICTFHSLFKGMFSNLNIQFV